VASKVFKAFQTGTSAQVRMVDQSSFTQKVMAAEQTEDIPALEDEGAVARFALSRIIADATSVALMERITTWLSSQYGSEDVS
jgi:hypothetical protein